ncbi:MAG TPA: hypothetical protein ENI61_01770 [Ignavibacteria bacterium]|nr:hypothetical protein [Ignavibacteria bacterium]
MEAKTKDKNKIALCCASGGHYDEMMVIIKGLRYLNKFLVVSRSFSNREEDDSDIQKYYVIDYGDTNFIRKIYKLCILFFQNIWIFYKEKPNVVITTGPATGLILSILVRSIGGKVVFIECSAQVERPSISGRLYYHIAHKFFVQWSPLLKYYPKAIYKGQLLR